MRRCSDITKINVDTNLYALKSFAKEIGVPEAFIVDAAKEQNSLKVKKFLNDIGTIL